MNMLIVAIVALGAILLYIWSVYNDLVSTKTRITASIQEIGNQLKRQADLIPNLIESVKGYMKHEQVALDKITQARKAVLDVLNKGQSAKKLMDVSNQLLQAIAPIRAVFESTPQLQAAGPTQELMDELRDTANKVMYARRTLIDLVADYNIKLRVFPSNLVAKFLNFTPEEGLEMPEGKDYLAVSSQDTKTPKVDLG
ncbi:LemA family protein [Candidatus Gottesmanbacteria bacterium]|nr:LemA family protein [Candidatus Gottesmanbacteria bacterium]